MKQTGLTWEVWVSCAPGDARALKRLRAAMAVCGIPDAAIVEYSADNEVRLSWYNTSSRQAHAMRSALRASLPLEVGAHIHALKNSDWQSRWKESLHPFMLTRNIRVVPAWNKGRRTRFSGETIYIDTVLAFGTGLHPTTRLTAGFIENKRNEIKEFLDIGTGTGILSIVARKYGVSWVGGLDNDF
jgi:ribosomal protein L11 methylase PrmA